MYCGKCGSENSNDAKFCRKCGQPLKMTKSVQESVQNQGETNIADVSGKTDAVVKAVKKISPKMIGGLAAGVVVIALIIVFAVKAGNVINLNKYVSVESSGYNGYGEVKATIDWDAIDKKYGKKVSFTKSGNAEYGWDDDTPIDAMEDLIDISIDAKENLSNGDEVAYKWKVDRDIYRYVNCKIKYKDGTFKVSDLQQVEGFDAFKDVKISYSGVGPNGMAEVEYAGSDMVEEAFSCSPSAGLSNGDTVTVSIDKTIAEVYVQVIGKMPVELTKTYTVEGLGSYLSSASQLSESALNDMKIQAEDVYNAHVAQSWGEGEELKSLSYLGNYLLTAKNSDSYGNQNCLFLVYKAKIKNTYDTYKKGNSNYWFIRFDNIIVNGDGTIDVDLFEYSTPNNKYTVDSGISSGWYSTKTWSYYGYQTLEELHKAVVTSNRDQFNYEENIDKGLAYDKTENKSDTESDSDEEYEKEESSAYESGYVLPDSDVRALTYSDLAGLSAEDCKIARNEIYARHGRLFKDKDLQDYFNNCEWYDGKINPNDFDDSVLSEVEKLNRDLIVKYEKEQGFRD